jgi:hypothetical protein
LFVETDNFRQVKTLVPKNFSMAYEDGALPEDQQNSLIALALHFQPSAVLEIGTFFGATTRRLALALPFAVIHTLDLSNAPILNPGAFPDLTDWHLINRCAKYGLVGRDFFNMPKRAGKIVQHFGDSMDWDFGLAWPADFFFIDGSHSYRYCKNDSEKCFNLCAGRGVFVWHDAAPTHPGVLYFIAAWQAMGRAIKFIAGTTLAFYDSKTVRV